MQRVKYDYILNKHSIIPPCFSHDGKYITAGSENQCVYLWRTNNETNNLTVRKDRNSHWEAIKGKFDLPEFPIPWILMMG